MYEHTPFRALITGHRRTRATWLLVAAQQASVLPELGYGEHVRGIGEPKSPRPAHESYKWMSRIRPERP
jgi:hypothetical protein